MSSPRSQPSMETKIQPTSKEGTYQPTVSPDTAPKKPGSTFSNQDTLPKLPIPDLASTCKKYLEALSALQTPREQEETRAAVQDFLKSDGPILQEKLKNYASSKTSYIEQFSVVLNLNPFFLLEDDPTPARNHQVTRAASLVVSALSFVRAVRREELPPDTVRGTPLCMYQYSRLFGTARVPTENGCVISQDPHAKHIVVLCRGQFYWFDVLDENNDLIMTEKDIAVNLQVIVNDAEQTPIQDAAKGCPRCSQHREPQSMVGTARYPDQGRGIQQRRMLEHRRYGSIRSLPRLYPSPATRLSFAPNMLCGTSEVVKGVQVGTCTNRWYDKLQIIVCQNGSAGINFEHTGVDGHTVLRFASDVYTDTILRFARTINGQGPSLWASTSPDPSKRDPRSFGNVSTTPRKLEWDMVPEVSIALRFAESHLSDLLQQHEFHTLEFSGYGKNFITSMGFSPDAFVQMAFQAAYYGLYGRIENTYEPAMTKFFLHGRTEAVRTVTNECVNFVKTFWGEVPPQDKVNALRKATEKHTAITKECSKGQGQDRHLYALYCLWQRSFDEGDVSAGNSVEGSSNGYSSPTEGSGVASPKFSASLSEDGLSTSSYGLRAVRPAPPTPALFSDPGWDKINNTVLSTSNCGNPCLRHFGFGPTSADGFGIGYIIKDESISICASSKHRQTARLMQTLESYLFEIRKLLRATSGKTTSPRTSRAREMEMMTERFQGEHRRGRIVRGDGQIARGAETPTTDSGELEDDGMGGYGFFDAGMLLHALKGLNAERERGGDKPERRRFVGKKLRLNEY
ncbi:hypothetical protein ATEG_00432 [Aspergillus terreus NIH2624]|uniref:Choline/carnitine acyltransferase domain-containing protein n=1 Tax=Aspergillus terreus (strain NIH 2624 / FGSC A1156) TaxID=341663 RepID=Q0D0V2_ASPTN|nr:uncharacterized protein ATEG_00432 [Aspergillus terreus NIH2624]EAU39078.1 hypothetical protein ATEG_00432 [Aspergillus terreus NIH2624]